MARNVHLIIAFLMEGKMKETKVGWDIAKIFFCTFTRFFKELKFKYIFF